MAPAPLAHKALLRQQVLLAHQTERRIDEPIQAVDKTTPRIGKRMEKTAGAACDDWNGLQQTADLLCFRRYNMNTARANSPAVMS
jgi:plasmid maintenance system antidote protein VapI